MEEEGVKNFKELRAKFQKFDAPTLPGPIKFPAGDSQKDEVVCARPIPILAKGKPISSNHNQPLPYSCNGESPPQKTKVTQRSEMRKSSSSPGPLAKSTVCSTGNFQKASVLLDVTGSKAEVTPKERVVASSSFRDKLRNWEKVSSQRNETSSALPLSDCGGKAFHLEGQKSMGLAPEKPRKKLETKGAQTLPSQRHLTAQRKSLTISEDPSSRLSPRGRKSQEISSPERGLAGSTCQPVYECQLDSQTPEKQPDIRQNQFPKTKPLPSTESLGPPPAKPSKPPRVDLQAFQRQPASIAKAQNEVTVKEDCPPPESAEFEEPHNYEATISYRRHSGNSINLCTAIEIADSTYEVEIEELQKPWKSFLHQELSPKHENPDRRMKEKGPCDLEPQTEKDPHTNSPSKVDICKGTPAKIQMTRVHEGRRSMPNGKQETLTDILQTKVCPEDMKLASGGYMEALEVTKETSGPGAFKSSSLPEETYDDVEYPKTDGPKLDFSSSFTSDSEENSEEMYEDIYKTKSNYPKIDLDGKEALKRLQQFFRKEKGRFKMKKTKSKENASAFSISLPDLELRSQEVIIYDDVDISEKESKDEDKIKTWKPKFLVSKEKKEKKGADASESFSPRKFFRTKMQNLEKNRIGKEEKHFRERFQYDKEIIVINRAVVCSSNSRNGIFDLPITPGEELEVIDTTEQNLVICRNSKGKYGYVLIEHLDFKSQGWSR
ncbi:FYN-binding protein 2 isoform X1 [Marmota monax]|uniref:FYN-binding protein 2 isoform X1 n=1 Tax=Marmota monax TaxID=9995 RepID=UPI001EB04EE0|nr:FYN-binding protein 2 isoform X1 [Marmota monax]